MTTRRISAFEQALYERLDDLADRIDKNKSELIDKIDENKRDHNERMDSIYSWMEEQSKHCNKVHTNLNTSFVSLQTDYKNTKKLIMSQKDFRGKLALVLITAGITILVSVASWVFNNILKG